MVIELVAQLAIKRSEGVAPEVALLKCKKIGVNFGRGGRKGDKITTLKSI